MMYKHLIHKELNALEKLPVFVRIMDNIKMIGKETSFDFEGELLI